MIWGYIASRWAAITRTHERSVVVEPSQDAEKDFTQYDREMFLSEVRSLARNDSFVNRVIDLVEMYAIGKSGLQLKSASRNREWAEVADRAFSKRCNSLDLANMHTWDQIQKIAAIAQTSDGENHMLLTTVSDGVRLYPKIQLLESHRCASPRIGDIVDGGIVVTEQIQRVIVDGVQIDPITGEPLYYWYWYKDRISGEKRFMRVPAEFVVVVSDPSRSRQYRSPSPLYAVVNDVKDLAEWQRLMKLKLKDGAESSKVYKTKGGPNNTDNLRRALRGTSAAAPQTTEQRVENVRKVLGGKTINIDSGEDIQEFRSDQPALTTQNFWENVASRAAAGVNIPLEVVFPKSIQGTMARAVFDMAHDHFSNLSKMYAEHFAKVWRWVIKIEAAYDSDLANFPEDWESVTFVPPKAINVDVGRTAKANIDNLDRSITTLEELYSAKGGDAEIAMRQRAKEIKRAMEIEEQEGIPKGSLGQYAIAMKQGTVSTKKDEEDEEES